MPTAIAKSHLNAEDGPYEMRIVDSQKRGGKWAYFYIEGEQVWDCSNTYALNHFKILKTIE